MAPREAPIGVILAGGSGRRIGGSKATVKLRGRALISYPLAALGAVLEEVAVVAKADTELPSLPGITVWIEPAAPRHPLVGLTHALALADGRAVLACAADMPFLTAEVVEQVVCADPGRTPAVIAAQGGRLHPLLGCYRPEALAPLAAALAQPDVALRDAVMALGPRLLEIGDADALFNINAPEDLLQAAAMLDRRISRR